MNHPAAIEDQNKAQEQPGHPVIKPDLDDLLKDIHALEGLVAGWDEHQRKTVDALRRANDALHREAVSRLIRGVKPIPGVTGKLKEILGDEVVYAVLRHLGIIKPSLHERIEQALDSVRPFLGSHGGNVEIVEIIPPDSVKIRLLGACDGCPASGLTLSEGVEKAIKEHCPEITRISKVSGLTMGKRNGETVHFISPFGRPDDSGWAYAAMFDEIPQREVKRANVAGHDVILSRFDNKVTCYENACAHLGLPLDQGKLKDGILTCPYHAFEYSLESGECLTVPQVQLLPHAVRVVGNRVEIKLS